MRIRLRGTDSEVGVVSGPDGPTCSGLTLSQKALHHTLCCPFYSTLDVKPLHVHVHSC